MKVIKRDGRLEDFALTKIKTSIERASDDAQQPFNVSDISNLAMGIEAGIKKLQKDTITSDIIQNFVLSELVKEGFEIVSKYYNQGKVE